MEVKGEVIRDYWPTDNWQTNSPVEQSMSSSILNEMSNYINDDTFNYDSIIIVKNGYIVFEEYFNFNNEYNMHHLFSVTKSFVSALIGIAIEQEYIQSVHQKVVDFFPDHTIENLDELKEEMTIEHLLTMTSGFEWAGDSPRWYDMMAASNQVQFMLDLPMDDQPGSQFMYNSGSCQLMTAILQNTTGVSALNFAQEVLFNPLGIDQTSWQYDKQGINIGGTLLYTTPRDMARLGYLYLNNGTWDGEQILPNDWVINSTMPYTSSSFETANYGYYWWLDHDGDYYYACGSEGQKIFVIPEYDLVVVFTATSQTQEPYEYLLENYILPANDDYTPKASISAIAIISISLIVITIAKRKLKKYP